MEIKGELYSISYSVVRIMISFRGRNWHIRSESKSIEKYRYDKMMPKEAAGFHTTVQASFWASNRANVVTTQFENPYTAHLQKVAFVSIMAEGGIIIPHPYLKSPVKLKSYIPKGKQLPCQVMIISHISFLHLTYIHRTLGSPTLLTKILNSDICTPQGLHW